MGSPAGDSPGRPTDQLRVIPREGSERLDSCEGRGQRGPGASGRFKNRPRPAAP